MNSRPRRSYSRSRTRFLVEGWEELVEKKATSGYGLDILCELADLGRALARLNRGEREVVLLHGQAGLTVRTTGVLLDTPFKTVARRYERALERLNHLLNGEA